MLNAIGIIPVKIGAAVAPSIRQVQVNKEDHGEGS